MKRALITGITGQDGSYLTELLLSKGYEVHGIIRRSSTFNTGRIDHLYRDPHEQDVRLHLHYGDMADSSALQRVVAAVAPHEIYNLAAQSHVRVSFDAPEYTADVTGVGALRMLEAAKRCAPEARFYQASSSEMFGNSELQQSESTPMRPCSPYAAAKLYAFNVSRNYRDAYSMFVVNGILFNHESERRNETFVSRKITRGVARIAHGRQEHLYLGNLDAWRDWGHAEDYVEAMWRMLQHDEPLDLVIGTGKTFRVRAFVQRALERAGLGDDVERYVRFDARYLRPNELSLLHADPRRAEKTIGWTATTTFCDLVDRMVSHDMLLETHGETWEREVNRRRADQVRASTKSE